MAVVSSWTRSPRLRWVVTAVAFLHQFLANGNLYNYSILFVSLQREFRSGSAVTGWPGSIASGLICFISPFTVLLDHKLRRRTVILAGVTLYCAGLLVTSFMPALAYVYLTYGILIGIGANFMMQPSLALLLDWFPGDSHARPLALATAGSTAGMMVFSPVITACITHYGWRNALRILTGIIFVVGATSGVFMVDPPTRNKAVRLESTKQIHELETMVQVASKDNPDQASPVDAIDKVTTAEAKSNESLQNSKYENFSGMLRMMRNMEPWLWSVGNTSSFVGWTFFNTNFADFMDGISFNSNEVATVVVCFAGGELGGKLILSVVGNRLPFMYLYVVTASCVLGGVAVGLLTIAKTYLAVLILAGASGFIRSGVYSGIWLADAELFHEKYGTNNVMVLSLIPSGVGVVLSAPLSGGLFDVTGSYVVTIIVIAAIFICASIAFLLIPLWRRMKARGFCRSTQQAVNQFSCDHNVQ